MNWNVNLDVSGQSLNIMNKTKPTYTSKASNQVQKYERIFVCCSALISLSGMENTILPNVIWMARVKERDQTLKASLPLRAQRNQRPGHSWPKHTPQCYVLHSHLSIPTASVDLFHLSTDCSVHCSGSFHGSQKMCSRDFFWADFCRFLSEFHTHFILINKISWQHGKAIFAFVFRHHRRCTVVCSDCIRLKAFFFMWDTKTSVFLCS